MRSRSDTGGTSKHVKIEDEVFFDPFANDDILNCRFSVLGSGVQVVDVVKCIFDNDAHGVVNMEVYIRHATERRERQPKS
jgi:hypothetical protein